MCVLNALDRGEKARKEEFIKVALLSLSLSLSLSFLHTLTGWCSVGVRKKRRTEKCQSYDSEHTMMVEQEGRAMNIWTNILVLVAAAMVELYHFGRCV